MRGALGGAVAISLAAAPPSLPQRPSVLGGLVRADYADTASGSALVVAPRLDWESSRLAAIGEASFTRFTSGPWSAQGYGQLAGTWGLRADAAAGFLGALSASYLDGGTWSFLAGAGPMGVMTRGPLLASLALGAGLVRRVDGEALAVLNAALRTHVETPRVRLGAALTGTGAGSLSYLDLAAIAGTRAGAVRLDALVGHRLGDLSNGGLWQVRLDVPVGSWGTVEAALGAYPEDITGFTEGEFATLGLRWRPRSRTVLSSDTTPSDRTVEPVRVERVDTALVRVTFVVAQNDSVAIAGDWNQWTPVPLTRREREHWTGELPLSPGVYKFVLVLSGERWIVPNGVLTLPDDFGGKVGLLVVPGG